jgi:starch synthase
MFRLLFVTSEIDDDVRTGGLAAVSVALPRALRSWTDTRLLPASWKAA